MTRDDNSRSRGGPVVRASVSHQHARLRHRTYERSRRKAKELRNTTRAAWRNDNSTCKESKNKSGVDDDEDDDHNDDHDDQSHDDQSHDGDDNHNNNNNNDNDHNDDDDDDEHENRDNHDHNNDQNNNDRDDDVAIYKNNKLP